MDEGRLPVTAGFQKEGQILLQVFFFAFFYTG